MRSRYAAYALGNSDYIIETTDPGSPLWNDDRQLWASEISEFSRSCEFLGVDVSEETTDGDHAFVTFRARLTRGKRDASFGERSQFVRRDGRWLYHDGIVDR